MRDEPPGDGVLKSLQCGCFYAPSDFLILGLLIIPYVVKFCVFYLRRYQAAFLLTAFSIVRLNRKGILPLSKLKKYEFNQWVSRVVVLVQA